MAPSLTIMSINYDIYPMDVSDLSCGESTGRNTNTLDTRRRIPRKERAKKTRRDRRKNREDSDDGSQDGCEGGADLRLRRASTADGPLVRRRRPRSPAYATASDSPVPPLRRVSTESAIDFGKLNVAPLLPRRRTSIQLNSKTNDNGMDDTLQTASMTEYYDESTRGDEGSGYRTSTLLIVTRSSTAEQPKALRRKQTMDSLPSMPSSSRVRAQAPGYRRNQSMDSIPVRPVSSSLRHPRATGAKEASLGARHRSQLTLAEANNKAATPSFRRNQSMDSLPSIPRRRSSMASTSSRPQSNAVWN